MGINLEAMKVIDVHSHPFHPTSSQLTEEKFLEQLSLSVIPNMFQKSSKQEIVNPGMNMYMQITIKRLAEFYKCEPTVEQVVKKRNEFANDFQSYTQSLFQDVNIKGMIVDFGYPTPTIPKKNFENLIGVPTWEVYRIEQVMDRHKKESENFIEFIENYREDLRNELSKQHVVGLKSIIAYRTGLNISEMDVNKAAEQFETFRKEERAKSKALRDYCLHIAMEECTLADKVMHIHTGIGDGEVLLDKANPSLLIHMLREEKYANTKVQFVHGGYPWMEEAAFITSVLPNVYMDISLQSPFSGHGVKRIISQVFEFAPFNKVMYGSDAFTVPETNWLGVRLFKECFEDVLNLWIKNDYMDKDVAYRIAEMVLYDNFKSLYNIERI